MINVVVVCQLSYRSRAAPGNRRRQALDGHVLARVHRLSQHPRGVGAVNLDFLRSTHSPCLCPSVTQQDTACVNVAAFHRYLICRWSSSSGYGIYLISTALRLDISEPPPTHYRAAQRGRHPLDVISVSQAVSKELRICRVRLSDTKNDRIRPKTPFHDLHEYHPFCHTLGDEP